MIKKSNPLKTKKGEIKLRLIILPTCIQNNQATIYNKLYYIQVE